MRPAQAVSDVVRDIKSNSSAAAFATFSRLSEIIKMDVLWAAGYLAESVSPGDLGSSATSSTKPGIMGKFEFRARQDAKHVDYGKAAPKIQRPPSP
jgi:hypothetical protein